MITKTDTGYSWDGQLTGWNAIISKILDLAQFAVLGWMTVKMLMIWIG